MSQHFQRVHSALVRAGWDVRKVFASTQHIDVASTGQRTQSEGRRIYIATKPGYHNEIKFYSLDTQEDGDVASSFQLRPAGHNEREQGAYGGGFFDGVAACIKAADRSELHRSQAA